MRSLVPRVVSEPLFQSSSQKINSAGNEVELMRPKSYELIFAQHSTAASP